MSKVVIIGGGISGLLTAYTLVERGTFDITIIDKGRDITRRKCQAEAAGRCLNCSTCDIMYGLGGCGAFSDGKFINGMEYGGWLKDYLDPELHHTLLKNVDSIMTKFALMNYSEEEINHTRYLPDNEIKKKCLQNNMTMQQTELWHIGSDRLPKIMESLIDFLLINGVEIRVEETVLNIDTKEHTVVTSNKSDGRFLNHIKYDKCIIAVGRGGAKWFQDWCIKNNIKIESNRVDIGVRVELPRLIWEDISKKIYEPKILYKTKNYHDTVRMFCFNSGGKVVIENTNGLYTVNGHANSDESLKTDLSNFSLLTSIHFTEPFNEPIRYAESVVSLCNMISRGGVMVQRFGDLINGRRTTSHRLNGNSFRPSLEAATPGDLSLCLPKRFLDNIIETLNQLNIIAPGTNNDDTLLYGVEAKYYSARPSFMNDKFEITNDIYAIGDGSGVTRSLSHAAAMGNLLGTIIE